MPFTLHYVIIFYFGFNDSHCVDAYKFLEVIYVYFSNPCCLALEKRTDNFTTLWARSSPLK